MQELGEFKFEKFLVFVSVGKFLVKNLLLENKLMATIMQNSVEIFQLIFQLD